MREEVDRVVGTGPVTVEHMTKLPYIEAVSKSQSVSLKYIQTAHDLPKVLRETLRLDSPIPVLTRQTNGQDQMLRGKYAISKDDVCLAFLPRVHTDPAVYKDPMEFRPERMSSENFSKLPKNAWKPFGHGFRAVSLPRILTDQG